MPASIAGMRIASGMITKCTELIKNGVARGRLITEAINKDGMPTITR